MVASLPSLSLIGLSMSALLALQTKPAAPKVVEPRKWPHESSDLKPDPRFNFGALKNGMRYVWIDNPEPKKQIFLRLHVNIGSLVETDAEQGIAHFVEHMAFNGTTNFKAGTLVATFNQEGIKFGHDVNAHTSMEETVYELDLPDGDPERLKKSMLWMRDVACGLKMEEKEVQGEKGVIDSEERDRRSPGFDAYVGLLGKALDGTLPPKRLPIGVKEVRAKFNAKTCIAFYKRWYRPENMTFVVAGDLAGLDAPKLIEESLGTIPIPKDAATPRPDLGRPTFAHKVIALEQPVFSGSFGGSDASIIVAKLRHSSPKPFDAAFLAEENQRQIVTQMTSTRFEKRKEKDQLPYTHVAAMDAGSFLDAAQG